MAEFVKPAGNPGKWDAEERVLTVTLGEMVQLILVGGGPNGEKLVVNSRGVPASNVQEFPWTRPNERLFVITPVTAGGIAVQGWVPNGPAYTGAVRIVVLPRKPSQLGPEHVIVWTGYTKGILHKDEVTEAEVRAANIGIDVEVRAIMNYSEFVSFMNYFRDSGRRIGQLEFNTHGAPGFIGAENAVLDTPGILRMQGRGYHGVFASGARVFFHGCNVAAERKGIEFLKAFGKVFLFNGGGSVAGSTSVGFGTPPIISNGKVYHLWGDTRRLYFNTAGKVEKSEGITDQADLDFLRG